MPLGFNFPYANLQWSAVVAQRRIIIIPVATVAGYYLLRAPINRAVSRLFAHLYVNYFLEDINEALHGYRIYLKSQILLQIAKREDDDKIMQVLEIGMGPGSSLEYYPNECRIVGLEPNVDFYKKLVEMQRSNPNFIRVINGFAENMKEIPDESVDIVVSTLVLCSVKNLDKSVKEVKRVLKKGGRFYFFEHQACHESWTRYILQVLVSLVWPYLFDGCHLSRQISRTIERNGFQMAHVVLEQGFLAELTSAHAKGYVIKP